MALFRTSITSLMMREKPGERYVLPSVLDRLATVLKGASISLSYLLSSIINAPSSFSRLDDNLNLHTS